MSLEVLALVVTAAFAHAAWNFIAKGAIGGAVFVWATAVAGTVLYVPVLVYALVTDPGPLGWLAVGLMAGSGALHAVYGENADPEEVASKAVEAAIALDLYCGGAVTTYSVPAAAPAKKRKK